MQPSRPTLSILIPCYNEECAIPRLVQRLQPVIDALSTTHVIEVICIDDGSQDATARLIADLSRLHPWLRLVSHETNRGLGRAIDTGIAASRGRLIAMLDADGTFPPEDLPRLLHKVEEGSDIVIGSPYHPDGCVKSVAPFRLFVSRSLSRVYRFLTKSQVYSFSGIYRVYRRHVFDVVRVRGSGFAAVSEIILDSLASGFRIAEVPTTLARRQLGASKLRFWPEVWNHSRLLWRVLRFRMRGFPPSASARPTRSSANSLVTRKARARTAAQPGGRRRTEDNHVQLGALPLQRIALVSLLAVVFLRMMYDTWLKWPDIIIDFGEELYVPWRMVAGAALYRDINFLRGPLSPCVNAGLFTIFGAGFLTLVYFNILVVVLVCCILFALFRRAGGDLSASAACALFLLLFAFSQYELVGNYNFVCPYSHEQTHGCAIALASILALAQYAKSRKVVWAAAALLGCGLLALTKPEIFCACAAALGTGLLCLAALRSSYASHLLKRSPVLAAALVLPALVAAAFFQQSQGQGLARALEGWRTVLVNGSTFNSEPLLRGLSGFDSFWANVLTMIAQFAVLILVVGSLLIVNHALRRRRPRWTLVAVFALLVALFRLLLPNDVAWIGCLRWLPLALLAYLIHLGRAHLRDRTPRSEAMQRTTLLMLVVFAICMLGRIILRVQLPRYGFSLALVGTLIAFDMLIFRLAQVAKHRSGYSGVYTCGILALIFSFSFAHLELSQHILSAKTEMVAWTFKGFKGGPRTVYVKQALAWIDSNVGTQETYAVIPEGVILNFVTGHRNPTRYTTYNPILFRTDGEQTVLGEFTAHPPDYIIMVDRDNTEHGARTFGTDYAINLGRWIHDEYRTIVTFGQPPLRGMGFGIEVLKRAVSPPQDQSFVYPNASVGRLHFHQTTE